MNPRRPTLDAPPARGARRRLGVIMLVAIAPVLASSCRDVLGIDDRKTLEDGAEGGSGPGTCDKSIFPLIAPPPCQGCLDRSCCAAIDACTADDACLSCLAPDGFCAPAPSTFTTLVECVHDACEQECYPTPGVVPELLESYGADLAPGAGDCLEISGSTTCNPTVPSTTCNWEAGTTCDFNPRQNYPSASGFGCYLSHRKHINEACGLVEGMCHFGLTCVKAHGTEGTNYRCMRFCCHDDECGNDGVCDPAFVDWKFQNTQPNGQTLGLCVPRPKPN